MRTLSLFKKEWKEIIKDKGFILTLIIEPIIFILIFGYGFSSNIENISTIVIDEDNSNFSRVIVDAIDNSKYLNIVEKDIGKEKALNMVNESRIRNLILIPPDFGKNLNNGKQSSIKVYIDSSDYFMYSTTSFGLSDIMKDSLENISMKIIRGIEEEKEEKEKKFDEIKASVNELDPRVESITSKFEEIQISFNNTLKELEEIQEELEGGDLDRLEEGLENISNNLNAVESELESIMQENPELEADLTPIIAQVSILEEETENIEDELNSMGVTSLTDKISDFKNKTESSKNKTDEMDEDIDKINKIYSSLLNDVNSVTFKLENLKKDFLSVPIRLEDNFIYGEISYFKYLVPGIMSLVVFFISVVSISTNIINEKEKNTFQRILTTPIRKIEIFLGKFSIFFFIGIIESVYVILLTYFFGVNIFKNFISVMTILSLLVASSVALGLFLSSLIKNNKQGMIIIPLIIIPSVLLSGIFSPFDILPSFMKTIAKIFPLYYSTEAIRFIIVKGTPLRNLTHQITALSVSFFNMLILTLISFKLNRN